MQASRMISVIMIFMLPVMTAASDLGVMGETYPILEMDLLDFIQMQLDVMQRNGELQKTEDRFRKKVAEHADRPVAVRNISRAAHNRHWIMNPSIAVAHDMRDLNGRVFARAGTIINPLACVTVHHPMVFINGDDPEQIQWIREKMKEKRDAIKLVLVRGSVSDTANRIQQPVYFDQEGKLTSKFHIRHVPAMVSQQEKHLLIQEEAI